MRIVHGHINPAAEAIKEAVRVARHRERSISGRMLAPQHSSGGFCTTVLQGSSVYKKWLLGDSMGTFRM